VWKSRGEQPEGGGQKREKREGAPKYAKEDRTWNKRSDHGYHSAPKGSVAKKKKTALVQKWGKKRLHTADSKTGRCASQIESRSPRKKKKPQFRGSVTSRLTFKQKKGVQRIGKKKECRAQGGGKKGFPTGGGKKSGENHMGGKIKEAPTKKGSSKVAVAGWGMDWASHDRSKNKKKVFEQKWNKLGKIPFYSQ